MPIAHFLLLLSVVVIWGMNFIFVKIGLQEIPPLLLCALRFFLASIPGVFFVKPPDLPIKTIITYGIVMFGMQFGFVFTSMYIGMPPGMASLLMQVQVFFTLFFAAFLLDEKPSFGQVIGALVSFLGIGLVAMHLDNEMSLLGFLCMLGAAASWGMGNLITKKIKSANLMSVVIWGSFAACFPMFILSLFIEGPSSITVTYHKLTWVGFGALLYIVYASTWVGYGIWNYLLGRYPMGTVVPFTLLVPVVGILSSVLIYNEPFQLWKLAACLLVISGLCINVLSMRYFGVKVSVKEAELR